MRPLAAAKKKTATPTDNRGAVEPTVRTFTLWTPALIRSAEIQADGGNLRYAANLCDWLLTDDRVSSGLRTRAQALLGLEPTFEKSGDKRRSGRAVKALEVGEDWWEAYPESELMQLVIWGLLLGVCPANQTPWTRNEDHGGRSLPTFEVWHPQHLRFDNPSRTWRIKVASVGAGELERELVPGDGEWVLHTPFGKNRPWAWGLWRCLGDLVLLKKYGWGDWGKVSERAILLVLTCLDGKAAEALKGYTKEARKQLASDIYARGSEAVAALPPGIDLKAVQAVVAAKDLQGELIKAADKAISIVIRGGNLTTDVSDGGSRSATETQAAIGDGGNLAFDAQALTTTIHDQSLVWWAQFNFGDPSLAPWPVYPVEEDEDLQAKTETDSQALENLDVAEELGLEVDRSKFLEEHRITWAKPGKRPEKPKPPLAPGWQAQEEAPAPNGGEGAPSPAQEPPAPNGEQPPPKPKAQARSLRLASGASSRDNRGFLEGQLYVDELVERSAEHGNAVVRPVLDAILEELDEATDYDDLRNRLRRRFADMPLEDFTELVYRAHLMADLAGRRAVTQDS